MNKTPKQVPKQTPKQTPKQNKKKTSLFYHQKLNPNDHATIITPKEQVSNKFRMASTHAPRPSKKAASGQRRNAKAIQNAFDDDADVTFGRVEAPLGHRQFRLRMVDGSEGRGSISLGMSKVRIERDQIVILTPAPKGMVHEIVGRIDTRKEANDLVKSGRIPKTLLHDDAAAAEADDIFDTADSDDDMEEDGINAADPAAAAVAAAAAKALKEAAVKKGRANKEMSHETDDVNIDDI
jgi:translation initiation factor IF-1